MHISPQNHEEWLRLRKNKIGASDAPIIMQVSPWKTPYQLWEEKVGIRTKPEMTDAMVRGKELENKALVEFEKMSGIQMMPQMMCQHAVNEWMMATLDGVSICGKYIVEIKCPGRADHGMALDGVIPLKYIPQMQHQLEVTGVEKAYYFSFDGTKGVIIEISRDQKYIDGMVDAEKKFYECMLNLIAPGLIDDDFMQRDDQEWISLAQQYRAVQRDMKALESQEKDLKDALILMTEGYNCSGGDVRVQKIHRKGMIDYKSIPQLKGVNLEQYRQSPVEFWKVNTA